MIKLGSMNSIYIYLLTLRSTISAWWMRDGPSVAVCFFSGIRECTDEIYSLNLCSSVKAVWINWHRDSRSTRQLQEACIHHINMYIYVHHILSVHHMRIINSYDNINWLAFRLNCCRYQLHVSPIYAPKRKIQTKCSFFQSPVVNTNIHIYTCALN